MSSARRPAASSAKNFRHASLSASSVAAVSVALRTAVPSRGIAQQLGGRRRQVDVARSAIFNSMPARTRPAK